MWMTAFASESFSEREDGQLKIIVELNNMAKVYLEVFPLPMLCCKSSSHFDCSCKNSLKEKKEDSMLMQRKREGRVQQTGKWMNKMSEEILFYNVWVWCHIFKEEN